MRTLVSLPGRIAVDVTVVGRGAVRDRRTMLAKKWKLIAVTSALLVSSAVGLAAAGGGRGAMDRAAVLDRYDANRNGVLDEPERARLREERRAWVMSRFDTDHDGMLSATERTAMREQRA